jgi:hypothetical protein
VQQSQIHQQSTTNTNDLIILLTHNIIIKVKQNALVLDHEVHLRNPSYQEKLALFMHSTLLQSKRINLRQPICIPALKQSSTRLVAHEWIFAKFGAKTDYSGFFCRHLQPRLNEKLFTQFRGRFFQSYQFLVRNGVFHLVFAC